MRGEGAEARTYLSPWAVLAAIFVFVLFAAVVEVMVWQMIEWGTSNCPSGSP